jgi:hypothetical protein
MSTFNDPRYKSQLPRFTSIPTSVLAQTSLSLQAGHSFLPSDIKMDLQNQFKDWSNPFKKKNEISDAHSSSKDYDHILFVQLENDKNQVKRFYRKYVKMGGNTKGSWIRLLPREGVFQLLHGPGIDSISENSKLVIFGHGSKEFSRIGRCYGDDVYRALFENTVVDAQHGSTRRPLLQKIPKRITLSSCSVGSDQYLKDEDQFGGKLAILIWQNFKETPLISACSESHVGLKDGASAIEEGGQKVWYQVSKGLPRIDPSSGQFFYKGTLTRQTTHPKHTYNFKKDTVWNFDPNDQRYKASNYSFNETCTIS